MNIISKIIKIKKEGGVVDSINGVLYVVAESKYIDGEDERNFHEWSGGRGEMKRSRIFRTDDKDEPAYGTDDVPSWSISSSADRILWPEKYKKR